MRLWDDAKALRRVTLWLYIVVVTGLCFAGFKWLWESEYFPIKNIHFYGEMRELNQLKMAQIAQQNITGNFLKADMNQLQQALAKDPWVESVKVQRLWPDTINIFVTERQAQAKSRSGGLVDLNGVIYAAKTSQNLPIYDATKSMMPKLVAFENEITPLLKEHDLQVKALNVNERGAWTLILTNNVELKLGRKDLKERVGRFIKYWQRDLAPKGKSLQYVDLRYHDGFAINQSAVADDKKGNEVIPSSEPVITENESNIN